MSCCGGSFVLCCYFKGGESDEKATKMGSKSCPSFQPFEKVVPDMLGNLGVVVRVRVCK